MALPPHTRSTQLDFPTAQRYKSFMSYSSSTQNLLDGLTEPQRQAVTHIDGPLLVLAGPGSGKTRVITHRAAYLAWTATQPHHILAITFTNKAANEMAQRMQQLDVGRGLTCATFHSFCARLLRIHAERANLRPNFSIFDQADQVAAMSEAVARTGLSKENFPPARILNKISAAKNEMISWQQYADDAYDWQEKRIADLYAAYETVLAEQNALDFDDLLTKTALLLGNDPELRDQLQQRYRYILVDEYQDTNHAQYLIARGLALDHENLCVTGDPDQSIYAWRGANLHNILQFEEDFPNAVVVRLEQNYRSTPQILTAADAVISHNRKRKEKKLWTANNDGPAVAVTECQDGHTEAAYIASQIRQHVDAGGTFSGIAIFYRVNWLSRNIEHALLQARIPYQVARGVAFYGRKEIKDTLAYLKLVANPADRVALTRIINVPTRGIGKTTVDRLLNFAAQTDRPILDILSNPKEIPDVSRAAKYLQSFANLMTGIAQTAETNSIQDTLEYVVRYSGLLAMWNKDTDKEALGNVHELISAATEYDQQHADGSGSLTDWLQQISLVGDVDAIDHQLGAVTLMTLHAAKGLEFDTVFIAGVEAGLLPHERSNNERADLEEERRLCFVGMTRAERSLTLTSAHWRNVHGIIRRTARSLFLTELPKDSVTWLNIGQEGKTVDHDDDGQRPASANDYLTWQKGQLVRHPTHGIGRVLWIRPASQGTYAGIHFAAEGEKTLVLEYAKLELIEPDELP